MHSLVAALKRGRSTQVWAGPQMGGSALMAAVAAALKTSWHERSGQPRWVPLRLDGARLPAAPLAAARAIWQATVETVLDPFVQAPAAPPRPPKVTWLGREDAFAQLQAACARLWASLANTPGWCRLLALVDHAEGLAADTAQGLFRWLEDGPAHAAVALGGIAWALAPPPALAAWPHLVLGVRRDADALAWCRQLGVRDPEPWLALSGKHPAALAALCDAARAAAAPGSDLALTPAVSAAAAAACAPLFAQLGASLRAAGPAAAQLGPLWGALQAAPAPAPVPLTELEAACGYRSVAAAAAALEAAGVVERVVHGPQGALRAGCVLFNRWAAEHW